MRFILIVLGSLLTGIGIVGIVTPLLPTTPFLILASICFAKSSPRFHNWLVSHPKLGPPVNDWQKNGVIRKPAKILATILILANASFPLFVINSVSSSVRILIVIVVFGVLLFIWSRPSRAHSNLV